MKRPNFNEKTEVKVIAKDLVGFDNVLGHASYGLRGYVSAVTGYDSDFNKLDKPYSPDKYPDKWVVDVVFKDAAGAEFEWSFDDWQSQLEAVQKKFIDIDYIREEDLVIGKKEDGTDAVRPKNTGAFEPGDLISITTKIDGANASIAWDQTTGKLEIFSRTNLLSSPGALRGFYDYIKVNVEPKIPWTTLDCANDIVIFGEWCISHTVKYNDDWYNKWRVYDIWDKSQNSYWGQDMVKSFCKKFGLEYVEELYYGPFISWDHCRSFIGKSRAYGPSQEGVVIKNQSKLGLENRDPVYIKIVDEKFKESQHSKKEKKQLSPEEEAEKQKAAELAASIVTEARVRKLILKLVDEGLVQAELQPKDMGAVMKLLPKRCFADCLKEEPETVKQLGEFAGKFIAAETAKQARKIVVGG